MIWQETSGTQTLATAYLDTPSRTFSVPRNLFNSSVKRKKNNEKVKTGRKTPFCVIEL